MEKKMKFRRILADWKNLGKRVYECDVPDEIIQVAKRAGGRYVGVGNWFGTRRKFVCFVSKDDAIYVDGLAFRKVVKFFRDFEV